MKTLLTALFCAAALLIPTHTTLSSPAATTQATADSSIEKKIIGKWKWSKLNIPEKKLKFDISQLLGSIMGDITVEYRQDHTYTNVADNLGEKETGKWRLEQNNTVITMVPTGTGSETLSAKIISVSADTLVVEIRKPAHLQVSMVRIRK